MNEKIKGLSGNQKNVVWSGLFLFGLFCFGYNMAIALHELGHVIAVLLDGGQIQQFFLNPFSWSWNLGKSVNNPVFTAWGGVSFGLILSTLPLIGIIWIRSIYYWVLVLVTAGCALLINGIYLVVGVFINVGDGRELIKLGVSSKLIFSLGLLYMIAAFSLWMIIQPLLGIGKNVPFLKRFLILSSGIFPYLLIIFFYNLVFNSDQIVIWSSFVLVGLLSILIMAVVGVKWSRSPKGFSDLDSSEIGWRPVVVVLIMGIGIVVSEFIIFGIKDNPF